MSELPKDYHPAYTVKFVNELMTQIQELTAANEALTHELKRILHTKYEPMSMDGYSARDIIRFHTQKISAAVEILEGNEGRGC